jgi:hypothetical protein
LRGFSWAIAGRDSRTERIRQVFFIGAPRMESSAAVTEEVKRGRGRAQVLRDKVQIRLAVNDAGPAIAEAMRKLGIQGIVTLRMAGCQYVAGSVKISNAKFRGVMEKMGFVKVSTTDILAKRLA